jgi:hypothetical protein
MHVSLTAFVIVNTASITNVQSLLSGFETHSIPVAGITLHTTDEYHYSVSSAVNTSVFYSVVHEMILDRKRK